ncbi:unnamed protein product [Effrenium voratum]|nr:unnamed protein product [Effrenium voratum]
MVEAARLRFVNLAQPGALKADIKLVQPEFLRKLHAQGRVWPRRQEAELEEGALYTPRATDDFKLEQLVRTMDCFAAFDLDGFFVDNAAFFIDYISLYQYPRSPGHQEDSFRAAMRAMHLCYANSGSGFSTYVWRIEKLTPQSVRARHVKEGKMVTVFSAAEGSVTGRGLESLQANTVAYQERGWCRAELEWSKPHSFNVMKAIPCIGRMVGCVKARNGRVPVLPPDTAALLANMRTELPWTPADFQGAVGNGQLKFTHRSDAEIVLKLQREVFEEKLATQEVL